MRLLLVDLNNFARYPSIAIGYLTAILRASGATVEVMAPLSTGAAGVVREAKPPIWGGLEQRLRYDTAVSRNAVIRGVRKRMARRQLPMLARKVDLLNNRLDARLKEEQIDVVLVSTYLMYHDVCVSLGRVCERHGVPMVIGGPYFAQPEVANEWIDIPALRALIGGEVEPHLVDLIQAVAAGEGVDDVPGVWSREDGYVRIEAPPLHDLDSVPFPDYSDFPWHLYPNRLVPLITGRGCGWGHCTFCSDITSTAGRTFRTRSPRNVLNEIEHQSGACDSNDFVFTDLKLNSNLMMWHSLLDHFQQRAPGGRWIASVHVPAKEDGGLSRDELERARAAGMVRLTTGLESGSQRVLNAMRKGARIKATERVIRDASEAGISVRTTMIIGYPGETAADVDETVRFLERVDGHIERIALNRLQVITGSCLHRHLEETPSQVPGTTPLTVNHRMAQVSHQYEEAGRPKYRRAIHRLISAVHEVNRRPLRQGAELFEGVM